MTVSEFDNGYWYADELKKFAKAIGTPGAARLRKDELEKGIRHFLASGRIENPTIESARRAKNVSLVGCLSKRRACGIAPLNLPGED